MLKYENYDLSFFYPENWTLEEEEDMQINQGSLVLTNPDGAFWILTVRPFGHNPELLAEDAIKTMKKEYPNLEIERITRFIDGVRMEGYEMIFYYLDLTNTAIVLTWSGAGRTFAVFWQTGDQLIVRPEKEPFSNEDIFEAITTSFLREMNISAE